MTAGRTSLAELAALFLRLGATAFGGPAVHIALLEAEVVRRRGWLTSAQFLDLLSATNLIPGPNSTELAIHIGFARGRWAGLVVAGVCFIVPAALITAALGWVYVTSGALPLASTALDGVKPVMLAIVAHAAIGLAPRAAPTRALRLVGVLALALLAASADELVVLGGCGVAAVALRTRATLSAVALLGAVPAVPPLPSIFLVFLKVGSVLYGSGYVLLAFLRADLVDRLGWLTEAQLLDAIAVGQLTPGPVFTTATFVGYLVGGPAGAATATAGIFLPAFVFVALSGPLVPRLRRSAVASAFLDGVNVASLALMVAVTAQLSFGALGGPLPIAVALVSLALLLRTRLNPSWLLLGGAATSLTGALLARSGA